MSSLDNTTSTSIGKKFKRKTMKKHEFVHMKHETLMFLAMSVKVSPITFVTMRTMKK
jgi:hypothetical protein